MNHKDVSVCQVVGHYNSVPRVPSVPQVLLIFYGVWTAITAVKQDWMVGHIPEIGYLQVKYKFSVVVCLLVHYHDFNEIMASEAQLMLALSAQPYLVSQPALSLPPRHGSTILHN